MAERHGGDPMIWAWWFGLVVLTSLVGLEIWAMVSGHPTLSATIRDSAKTYPIIPFLVGCAVGILAMHLFGLHG